MPSLSNTFRIVFAGAALAVAFGASAQERDPAAREAAAAKAAPGQLTSHSASEYQSNAVARCNALPAQHKQDCLDRITQGNREGSVSAGGQLIWEEKVIRVKP